jgi:sulfur-oxidizing protein SoxZ
MANSIKVRAKLKGDVTEVKALMSHPMETGLRKDKKTGEVIPAHFIQEVNCTWKDQKVMNAHWSGGVSKNPYIAFKFKGAEKGDSIELAWTDNKGEGDKASVEIK